MIQSNFFKRTNKGELTIQTWISETQKAIEEKKPLHAIRCLHQAQLLMADLQVNAERLQQLHDYMSALGIDVETLADSFFKKKPATDSPAPPPSPEANNGSMQKTK